MGKASEDLLAALHGALANEFARKIRDGEATAADLSAAAKFLKDNGIDCIGSKNEAVTSLADQMDYEFPETEEGWAN